MSSYGEGKRNIQEVHYQAVCGSMNGRHTALTLLPPSGDEDTAMTNYTSLKSDEYDCEFPVVSVFTGVYILIAVGAVMMLVGFLGCYGAIQESQCLLGTVSISLFDFLLFKLILFLRFK